MVLQIRFAIWLTLQIEVKALHICKPSHYFVSTISAFHVGLRPPGPPPRAISLRPSALPAARVHERRRTRPRLDDVRGHGAGTEVDLPSRGPSLGGGRRWTEPNWRERRRRRTTNAAWAGRRLARRPRLGGNWHARRTSKWREGKKRAARSVKKNSGVGSTLWVCQV